MDADGADIVESARKIFPKGPFLYLTKMEAASEWIMYVLCVELRG